MKLITSPNLVTAGRMQLAGKFLGFAIGPRSEHDLLDLDTDQGTLRLRAGVILPATVDREIVARPVRKGSAAAAPIFASLLCFECPYELAAGPMPRTNYILDRTTGTASAAATVFTVPFAGRRHVTWTIKNTDGADSLTWTTKGRRYYSGTSYDEDTLDTGAVAFGVTEVRHEGGSDHEEMFDVMVCELTRTGGSDADYAISAEVTGELGG